MRGIRKNTLGLGWSLAANWLAPLRSNVHALGWPSSGSHVHWLNRSVRLHSPHSSPVCGTVCSPACTLQRRSSQKKKTTTKTSQRWLEAQAAGVPIWGDGGTVVDQSSLQCAEKIVDPPMLATSGNFLRLACFLVVPCWKLRRLTWSHFILHGAARLNCKVSC
jgi:hypothetical protein